MFWSCKPKQERKPEGKLERRSLDLMAIASVRLAQPASYRVPGCAVYENISEFDPAFARQMNQHVYVDRVANFKAIDLVAPGSAKLPQRRLHGHGRFLSCRGTGAALVRRGHESRDRRQWPTEEIGGEVLIVARYGFWTWGHWLGELLPKMVMVEAAFPGRFRFIVPDTEDVPKWRNFRDSIEPMAFRRIG